MTIRVRPEGLISVGGISTGNIGIVWHGTLMNAMAPPMLDYTKLWQLPGPRQRGAGASRMTFETSKGKSI